MSKATIESLKEIGRYFAFFVVSFIIGAVLDKLASVPQSTTVVILTAVLRYIDKWIHEQKKGTFKDAIGILPF